MKSKKLFSSKLILIVIVILLIVMTASLTACADTVINQITVEGLDEMYSAVTDAVISACVTLEVTFTNGAKQSGAGVIITKDGYIVTNRHVVYMNPTSIPIKGKSCKVTYLDSKKKTYVAEADIIDTYIDNIPNSEHNTDDIALVKIRNLGLSEFNFLPFGDSDKLTYGNSGIIVGYPKSIGLSVGFAMVSNPSVKVQVVTSAGHKIVNHILLDAHVNPGNSGGGFIDMEGKFMGLVTLRHKSEGVNNEDIVFGIGYALPSNYVRENLLRYPQLQGKI